MQKFLHSLQSEKDFARKYQSYFLITFSVFLYKDSGSCPATTGAVLFNFSDG